LFLEMHHQSKGTIFKRRVRGSDDHGIPVAISVSMARQQKHKDPGLSPLHDIVRYW
jgi:hypothetical protein